MNPLITAIERTVREFAKIETPYCLIGGLAVSARTEPRFTRDADFALAVVDDSEAEMIVRHFLSEKYQVVATVEQDAMGRLATVRLSPNEKAVVGIVVDLLFASSGIEPEIVRDSDKVEIFENIILPVATIGHLLALKILSNDENRRPQDIMDIQKLIEAADEAELTCAREAVSLIIARGFHRGRSLETDLARFIQRFSPQ